MASSKKQRFVRFRDVAPPTNGGDESPVPLFSPTVMGSQGLLHSVFSPEKSVETNNGIPRRVGRHPLVSHSDNPSRRQSMMSVEEEKQEVDAVTPARGKVRYSGAQPYGVHATGESILNITGPSEIFFSPAQTAISSLAFSTVHGGDSPFSARLHDVSRITDKSLRSHDTSFKSLPQIQMLSVEYMDACRDAQELRQIVTVLEAEGKYPTLLKQATLRLQKAQGSTTVGDILERTDLLVLHGGSAPKTNPVNLNLSGAAVTGSSRNESSLIMSLSTDDEESSIQRGYNNTVRPNSSSRPSSSSPDRRQLYQQVQRLTQTIVEMESARTADHKEHCEKLERLKQAKVSDERKLQALERDIREKEASVAAALSQLDQMRQENSRLRSQLREGQTARQQARDVERQQLAELAKLQNQLAASNNKHESDRVGDRKRNQELNLLLRSAQRQLEVVRRERDNLIQSLLTATGRTKDKPRDKPLSKQERDRLVFDLRKKSAASNNALEAMAKTVSESEKDRREALQACQMVKEKLDNTLGDNRRLEHENQVLASDLQRLYEELAQSHDYATELIKTAESRHQREWEQREAMYKQIIGDLKNKVAQQENMVSVGLYKAAVADAKRLTLESLEYKNKVKVLEDKLDRLEKKIQNSPRARPSIQPQSLVSREIQQTQRKPLRVQTDQRGKELNQNLVRPGAAKQIPFGNAANRKVTFKQDSENISPKDGESAINKEEYGKGETGSSSTLGKSPDRLLLRKSILKKVGGRKGLQEMLKQMRSPRGTATIETQTKVLQQKLDELNIQPKASNQENLQRVNVQSKHGRKTIAQEKLRRLGIQPRTNEQKVACISLFNAP